jgi:hypothetical protein
MNGPPANGAIDGIGANFDVTRTQPILAKPSEYYASIVRMTLPLNSMPIFICPIADPLLNTTPWVVGISYNGNYYPQPLVWQTALYTAPLLNPFGDWTYWCYSYDTFVSMVNVAIAAAYAAFRAANPAAPQAVANQAPFLIYDAPTQLFSWVWHNSWATAPPATFPYPAGTAKVFLNYTLLSVFDGFRILLVGGRTDVPINNDQADYVFEELGDNGFVGVPALANTSVTQQSFVCVDLLATIRRVVVTTSSLPIVSEAVPGSSPIAGLISGANVASTLPILTDFVPQIDLSNDVRSIVYYVPTAQYRLTNLISDLPLYRVQLSFWWQATDGTLSPIVLSRNQQASAKLAFFKKSLYTKPSMPQ